MSHHPKAWIGAVALAALAVAAACGGDDGATPTPAASFAEMELHSISFPDGGDIPVGFTCAGAGLPLPFAWSGAPVGTVSFVFTMDDPDAGGFVHWLLWNIPPDLTEFLSPPEDAVNGKNSFGDVGYGPPCPPKGSTHIYRARIYALDATLALDEGATRDHVEDAMQGHVLARGQVTGSFGR